MKKESASFLLAGIIALLLFGHATAAPLSPAHWSSASTPGTPGYVPAGIWSETVVSTDFYDTDMLGSYGTMTAYDLPVPPYYSFLSAMDPVWQMTTYTRTDCTGEMSPTGTEGIFSGDFIATYVGDWQFNTPNPLDTPFTYDTYHVYDMMIEISYNLTYDFNTSSYTLSNMVWQGEGLIDEDHGYKFILYAEGSETAPRDPVTNVHSGVLTLTEGTVAAVPIPGAAWLFVTGLLGLLGIRRKIDR